MWIPVSCHKKLWQDRVTILSVRRIYLHGLDFINRECFLMVGLIFIDTKKL
jgi:hypothetical protein